MALVNPTHLLLVLAVLLVVLGPRRLPELGRSLGRGAQQFRAGLGGAGETGSRWDGEDG